MTQRVAITGIGVVAPGAIGVADFSTRLDRAESAVGVIDRFDTVGLRAHTAALVRDFKPRDFIAPMKMRRMNMLSRYAVSAARMAVGERGGTLRSDAGVVLGTCFGPVQTSVDYMQEYVEKGAALAPPQLFAESVANAPGSHVAIELDLRGFNLTMTQRESSALAAAMFGSSQIVKGTVPAALTGGVEEINEMVFSVLDRIGALAHADRTIDECSRPFDRRRNGMAIGEGSAVLLLEAEPDDNAYAYFSGFGVARDVTASISDWGTGQESVVAAMRAAIADAGLRASSVRSPMRTVPRSARSAPKMIRAVSVRPDPRRPASPTISPVCTSTLTPFNFGRRATSSTRSSGAPAVAAAA